MELINLTQDYAFTFVQLKQTFQTGFVVGEGIAGVATFHNIIQFGVRLAQVLWHLIGVVQVGQRLVGIELTSHQHVLCRLFYLRFLRGRDFGEGEGVVAELGGIAIVCF